MSAIQSFSLSPFNDNFVIVHAPEDFDVALQLDFKTELVATINKAKGSNCNISFKSKYEIYNIYYFSCLSKANQSCVS